MKKLYISPEAKIVKIHTSHMIALSQQNFHENVGKKGTVLSREINYWDDEEEEFKFEY